MMNSVDDDNVINYLTCVCCTLISMITQGMCYDEIKVND